MTYRIFVLRKERGTASLWFSKPKNLAISCVLGLGAAFAQADTLTLTSSDRHCDPARSLVAIQCRSRTIHASTFAVRTSVA